MEPQMSESESTPGRPTLHADQLFLRSPGSPTTVSIEEFWSWAFSDLQSDNHRGALATFLVAKALGISLSTREAYPGYDLELPPVTRIRVTAAGFLRARDQEPVSEIRFDNLAGPKSPSSELLSDSDYAADVYVFCLQQCGDATTYDPLDLSQWAFYPLPRRVLADYGARSLSLATVRRFRAESTSFENLANEVADLLEEEQRLRKPQDESSSTRTHPPENVDECLQSMGEALASRTNEAKLLELLTVGLHKVERAMQDGADLPRRSSIAPEASEAAEFRRRLEDIHDACEEFIKVQEEVDLATDLQEFQQLHAELQRLKIVLADCAVQRRVETEIRRLHERLPAIEQNAQELDDSELRQAILEIERQSPTCRRGHSMRILVGANSFRWTCSEFPHCWSRRPLTRAQLDRLQEATGEPIRHDEPRRTPPRHQLPAPTAVSPEWADRASQLLRAWRRDEAREQRLPAYRIMRDRTLAEILRIWPRTREQLAHVSGVGPATIEQHGDAILALLRDAERS